MTRPSEEPGYMTSPPPSEEEREMARRHGFVEEVRMSLLSATQPCEIRPPKLKKLGLRHVENMKAEWQCDSCGVFEWVCTWAGCQWWKKNR